MKQSILMKTWNNNSSCTPSRNNMPIRHPIPVHGLLTQSTTTMTEILQWNCNGIRSQYEDLQLLIKKYEPKIITLQETRTRSPQNFHLNGYETLSSHRPSGQGGTAIAVKTGIKLKNVQMNSNLEAVAVEVNIPRKMTICSIYLSPNQQINTNELENLINSLPKPFILSGDF